MFLNYQTYVSMGGTLEQSAFNLYNIEAENKIRSQAGGLTGKRIDKLPVLPDAVVNCTFGLITLMSANSYFMKSVTAESHSSDGVSESVTYGTPQTDYLCDNMIFDYFYGADLASLLYRGMTKDD